jgi:hypothetical protein
MDLPRKDLKTPMNKIWDVFSATFEERERAELISSR